MLARARERVPAAEFRHGDLHELPVTDAEADLVICALALTHVAELGPVLAEFARVLRPGGHLVISDMHPESILRGSIPRLRDPDGRPGRLPGHRHLVGDYLRAALPVGFQLRRCEEPGRWRGDPPATTLGPWEVWPWALAGIVPEAAQAANAGIPAEIIWHFQLAGSRI
jgi:ubiquinone/menaquinone biosynthesis C-methylase UbiE